MKRDPFIEVHPGARIGRWTVIDKSPEKRGYYQCVCECGSQRDVYKQQLARGNSLSCGCYAAEMTSARRVGVPTRPAGTFQISEEQKDLARQLLRSRWAAGEAMTPAFLESLAKIGRDHIGTPETGVNARGVGNKWAKHFRLRSPDGAIHEGKNLQQFIRDNKSLFDPADSEPYRNKYGSERNSNAGQQLSRLMRRGRSTWKGWRVAHGEIAND